MHYSLQKVCSLQDHSLLGHCCPKEMLKQFAQEVIDYGFRSLVVHGDKVADAAALLEGRADIGAVVGFPQGANTTASKIFEAVDALKNGATEIDTVVNFSKMRDGDYKYVKDEIASVVKAIHDCRPGTVTKFIIYMPYDAMQPLRLTQDEISRIGDFIIEGGADFIKYFNDHEFIVNRFRKEVESGVIQLKWSGCPVPYFAMMERAIDQGVTRFGTDWMPQALKEQPDYFAE